MASSWRIPLEPNCSLEPPLDRPESCAAPGLAGDQDRRTIESYALFKKKYYIRLITRARMVLDFSIWHDRSTRANSAADTIDAPKNLQSARCHRCDSTDQRGPCRTPKATSAAPADFLQKTFRMCGATVEESNLSWASSRSESRPTRPPRPPIPPTGWARAGRSRAREYEGTSLGLRWLLWPAT